MFPVCRSNIVDILDILHFNPWLNCDASQQTISEHHLADKGGPKIFKLAEGYKSI
jgi:hypothetical protein